MGFHDVEWAYSIDRPLAETAVLAALCHRTDDDTHETFVGQQAIASMIGSSPEKVLRALRSLEAAGVISRTRRHSAGGYRTSDLIRVNVATYLTNHPLGDSPTRQNAYQENRRDLPDDSSAPTWQKVTAEINQIDQPEDHPDLSSEVAVAPVREDVIRILDLLDAEIARNGSKTPSRTKANLDAARLLIDRDGATVEQIERVIRWCQADSFWRSNILSMAKLRDKYDQLRLKSQSPQRSAGRPTPTERAMQTLAAGEQMQRQRSGLVPIASLTPPDGAHRPATLALKEMAS